MTAYLESKRAQRTLLVTKDAVVRHWLCEDLLPSSTAVFTLHGPANARHCAFLKQQTEQRKLPLLFYGDLDPMDLSTFGTLRAGGMRWDFDPSTAVEIAYRGIDDRVLALVQRELKVPPPPPESSRHASQTGIRLPAIRMIRDEQRHLKVLEKLIPDLEALVGPNCADLLRKGWKLEVEALHSLDLKRGFATKLIRLILTGR